MRQAWAIFRETYHYPSIPFASLGRKCFGWCLGEAWRRAREAQRLAAMTIEEKASEREDRIAFLEAELFRTEYADTFRLDDNLRAARARSELARLAA